MKKLNSAQKQYLKGIAHHLKPVVLVGKLGLTEALLANVAGALAAHELIKVKFNDFQDEKEDLSSRIAESSRAILIGLVGNTALFYRRHPDPEKRKINLPS